VPCEAPGPLPSPGHASLPVPDQTAGKPLASLPGRCTPGNARRWGIPQPIRQLDQAFGQTGIAHVRPSKLRHRPTPLVNHCHAMVDERLWRKHKVYQTIAKGYSRPRTGQENMSMGLCGTVCLEAGRQVLLDLPVALQDVAGRRSAPVAAFQSAHTAPKLPLTRCSPAWARLSRSSRRA
jgi:hypothetical protein